MVFVMPKVPMQIHAIHVADKLTRCFICHIHIQPQSNVHEYTYNHDFCVPCANIDILLVCS